MTRLIWIAFSLSLFACASPTTSSCENEDNCGPSSPDAGMQGPDCGNGVCETGETQTSCAQDCGAAPTCGDNVCNGSETATSCAVDCAAKLLINNTSTLTIEYVYAWACTASNTNQDILGTYTLPPNYHIEFDNVNPGCWNFEAVSTTNATAFQNNTEMTPRTLFTWTLSN